jgi:general secretion pathway protein A
MYKQFFGLTENPFNSNPDPRFLFQTPETEEALACLTYGIQKRRGFVQLTGEVGTGKTTLLNKLLDWLRRQRVATSFVFNSHLTVDEFLDFMMADFGITTAGGLKSQLLLRLNQWLLERHSEGQTAVLVVDEAQNLSVELLEEIRLLTNLETATEKLLQIVLAGQPELEQKLNHPGLRQLRQRIMLRCKTHQLTREQTEGYITERLRIAGANGTPIFSMDAIEVINKYSLGIPRVINLLCEHSLIASFAEGKKPVPGELAEEVVRDFELDRFRPAILSEGPTSKAAIQNLESLRGLSALMDRLRGPA